VAAHVGIDRELVVESLAAVAVGDDSCSRRPVGDAPHMSCEGIIPASHREAATGGSAALLSFKLMLCG
jgi:hypothetical protein